VLLIARSLKSGSRWVEGNRDTGRARASTVRTDCRPSPPSSCRVSHPQCSSRSVYRSDFPVSSDRKTSQFRCSKRPFHRPRDKLDSSAGKRPCGPAGDNPGGCGTADWPEAVAEGGGSISRTVRPAAFASQRGHSVAEQSRCRPGINVRPPAAGVRSPDLDAGCVAPYLPDPTVPATRSKNR
jgi:hypothetical protein